VVLSERHIVSVSVQSSLIVVLFLLYIIATSSVISKTGKIRETQTQRVSFKKMYFHELKIHETQTQRVSFKKIYFHELKIHKTQTQRVSFKKMYFPRTQNTRNADSTSVSSWKIHLFCHKLCHIKDWKNTQNADSTRFNEC